jgi:hypothetical protein
MSYNIQRHSSQENVKKLFPKWKLFINNSEIKNISEISINKPLRGIDSFSAKYNGYLDFNIFVPGASVEIKTAYDNIYSTVFRGILQDPVTQEEHGSVYCSLDGEGEISKYLKAPWVEAFNGDFQNTTANQICSKVAGKYKLSYSGGFYDYKVKEYSAKDAEPLSVINHFSSLVGAYPNVRNGVLEFIEGKPQNKNAYDFTVKDTGEVLLLSTKYNSNVFFNSIRVSGEYITARNDPIGTTFLNNPFDDLHLVLHLRGTKIWEGSQFVDETPGDFIISEQVFGPQIDPNSIKIEGGSVKKDPETGEISYEGASLDKYESINISKVYVKSPWRYSENLKAGKRYTDNYDGYRIRGVVLEQDTKDPIPNIAVEAEYDFDVDFSEQKWYFFRKSGTDVVIQVWGFFESVPPGYSDLSDEYEQPDPPLESFETLTDKEGKFIFNNVPISKYAVYVSPNEDYEEAEDGSSRIEFSAVAEFVEKATDENTKKYIVDDTEYDIKVYAKYLTFMGGNGVNPNNDEKDLSVLVKRQYGINMMNGRIILGQNISSNYITSQTMAVKIGLDAIDTAIANYYTVEVRIPHNPFLRKGRGIRIVSDKHNMSNVFYITDIKTTLKPDSMYDEITALFFRTNT